MATSDGSSSAGSMTMKQAVDIGSVKFNVDTRYTPIAVVGTGAYGVVCSARDNKTHQQVAIKKIPMAFEITPVAKRTLLEVKLLKHFNQHENVVSLLNIIKPPKPPEPFNDVYYVMDLLESDLHRIIHSEQKLSIEHWRFFIDIKPSNLLLTSQCHLKICDFGTNYVNQLNLILNLLGTPSDELIAQIGSLKAQQYLRSLKKITAIPLARLYPNATAPAIDLLERMLLFDPEKRISMEDALAHPFLAKYHKPEDEPNCAPFDFEFEKQKLSTQSDLKKCILAEIETYHVSRSSKARINQSMRAVKQHNFGGKQMKQPKKEHNDSSGPRKRVRVNPIPTATHDAVGGGGKGRGRGRGRGKGKDSSGGAAAAASGGGGGVGSFPSSHQFMPPTSLSDTAITPSHHTASHAALDALPDSGLDTPGLDSLLAGIGAPIELPLDSASEIDAIANDLLNDNGEWLKSVDPTWLQPTSAFHNDLQSDLEKGSSNIFTFD
eukprot:gene4989-9272_t